MSGIKDSKLGTAAWLVLAASLSFTACGDGSDDDDFGGGSSSLQVTIGSVTTLTAGNGTQIICIPYVVSGLTNQTFTLDFEYAFSSAPTQLFTMTEISSALEVLFNVNSESSPTFSSNQNVVAGTFYWQVGADLGFVGTSAGNTLSLFITPDNGGTPAGQPIIAGSSANISYTGGSAAISVAGAGANPGPGSAGRAEHTAHILEDTNVSNIAVIGGIDGASTPLNALDRFSFDLGSLNYSTAHFAGQNERRQHASSFYFDVNGKIKILVTGGVVAGNPTATADVYCFSPTEQVTTPPADMSQSRARHCAVWLPNNLVLIVGGAGSDPSSCELFDPATMTFSAAASMPSPRADHTCCLLPDGTVLVAGGRDPAAPTTALAAIIYNPATNAWTSTGTVIDRYQHSATLLVNGVCYLIGGRTVSTDQILSDAHAYRTFAQDFPATAGIDFPAGFSPNTDPMNVGRTEHAASRLGTGEVLVTGGFNGTVGSEATTASAEVFFPVGFTAATLGNFTPVNSMVSGRARHSSTTTPGGTAVIIGGVNGPLSSVTVLDTVEAYQLTNTAPTASNLQIGTGNASDIAVTFALADVEGDRSFAFLRYSTDGGSTFNLATLNDFAGAVNLAAGNVTLHWNAAANGLGPGSNVFVQVLPVGGVFGAPLGVNVTL